MTILMASVIENEATFAVPESEGSNVEKWRKK
jgi:hypothetical protein